MDYAQELRATLLGLAAVRAAVGEHVFVSHVPRFRDRPYVWVGQAAVAYDECLDPGPDDPPWAVDFDVEVVAPKRDQARQIAAAIRALSHTRGPFGAGRCAGIFLENQSEDYAPVNDFSDDGLFLELLRLRVHYPRLDPPPSA